MGEYGSISSRNNKKHSSASAGDRSQPLLVRLWGVDMGVWAEGGPASEGASLVTRHERPVHELQDALHPRRRSGIANRLMHFSHANVAGNLDEQVDHRTIRHRYA